MSPQPLSRVLPNAVDIVFEPGMPSGGANLVLVGMVMEVIARWSYVDLAIVDLMSAFLRADIKVVNEMLLALTGSAQRRKLMDAAATSLGPRDLELYERVMKRVRTTEEHRNMFAHWIWAHSPAVTDALLLMDPKTLSRRRASTATNMQELRSWVRSVNMLAEGDTAWTQAPPAPEVTLPSAALDHAAIMVYRKNDLQREVTDVHRAELLVQSLQDAIALADAESRMTVEELLNTSRGIT